MKDKILQKAIQALSDSRRCETCPLEPTLCRSISGSLFGEEKCLILATVREIMAFHTEERKKEAKKFREEAKKKGGEQSGR